MSNIEAKDAYLSVDLTLPNGRTATGKPVMYLDACRMLLQLDEINKTGDPKLIQTVLGEFEQQTGIGQAQFGDLTLGEVFDAMQRFFYHRRPAIGTSSPAVSPGA